MKKQLILSSLLLVTITGCVQNNGTGVQSSLDALQNSIVAISNKVDDLAGKVAALENIKDADETMGGSTPTSNWKVYQDPECFAKTGCHDRFEIHYPRDFVLRYNGDSLLSGTGNLSDRIIEIQAPDDFYSPEKTNFNSAYVTVSIGTTQAERDRCLKQIDAQYDSPLSSTKTVNGITFTYGKNDGAAAGNLYESTVYRTFRKNICYELDLTLHSSNIGNYEPGAVKEFDKAKIQVVLDQIAKTFKFLN